MTGMMVGTCHGHRDLDDGEAQDVVYGPWALFLLPACLSSTCHHLPLPVPAIVPCLAEKPTARLRGPPKEPGLWDPSWCFLCFVNPTVCEPPSVCVSCCSPSGSSRGEMSPQQAESLPCDPAVPHPPGNTEIVYQI